MTTTFQVTEIKKGAFAHKPNELPAPGALKHVRSQLGWAPLHVFSAPKQVVYAPQAHGLWAAVHTSFECHLPLVLSPDHVWISIARVFAEHVVANAEELRKRFVDFEGQKTITVRRDDFVFGDPESDWHGVFSEFSDKIAESVGKARDLVVCNFSTTGDEERAVSQIVLMDAMQKYFKYEMMTCCGIPEITLLGTPADWSSVVTRTRALGEYGLQEWVEGLVPVLDQFVAASEGRADREWWQSFYKYYSMSGGDTIDGHIVKFFRYHAQGGRERKAGAAPRPITGTMSSLDIPHCISSVPFTWHYLNESIPMHFVGGLPFATIQDGAVRPAVAWGVGEATGK